MEIHKVFLDFIFLNELENHPDGISGYQLKKVMNELLSSQMTEMYDETPNFFSQSLVYREFKALKSEKLLDSKRTVVKNRNQILYTINARGKKRLDHLKKIIMNLAPIEVEPTKLAEDIFTGKRSPIEFLPKNLPKKQLLSILKSRRKRIESTLYNLNIKIQELEEDLS